VNPAPTVNMLFYQLIHQGTRMIPADFTGTHAQPQPHWVSSRHFVANCFAQAKPLMKGKTQLRHAPS